MPIVNHYTVHGYIESVCPGIRLRLATSFALSLPKLHPDNFSVQMQTCPDSFSLENVLCQAVILHSAKVMYIFSYPVSQVYELIQPKDSNGCIIVARIFTNCVL